MKREEKVLCLAMVLGDGHVRYGQPELSIKHGEAQKEYVEWKAAILAKAVQRPVNVRRVENGYIGYTLSVSHRFFNVLRNACYAEDRTPIFQRKILNKLTPKALAIWYMDDGSLYAKKRNGKIHAYELCISTCCNEENAQNIVDYFAQVWSVNFTIKRNKGLCSIRCGTAEAKKFIAIVEPFIVDCLLYKVSM